MSVIVPCRNESGYIAGFIKSVLSQKVSQLNFEIIIADGMSDDGTRDVLKNIVEKDCRIRFIDNPQCNTPSALNRAIKASKGDIILRMDVHTEYAPDYINNCMEVLEISGAENVGGSWHASGDSYVQRAISLAFQSPFSSGGAGSHSIEYEGEVDSVYLGCWKKEVLERVGMFDEELIRNQDDELNLRIIRSGGRVWQSPRIKSRYFPRASIKFLFKQYMQYGYWKVRVIQKHKVPASIRHLIPGGFVAMVILLAILSLFSEVALLCLMVLLVLYGLASFTVSIMTCFKPEHWKFFWIMPLVFAAYHFGYGLGFLQGIIDFILLRKGGRLSFSKITRGGR